MSEQERKPKKKLLGIQCRHISYNEANDGSKNDLMIAKEIMFFDDNTQATNLRFFENYKRPFWVTVESKRKNKYKKESEKLSHVRRYDVRQSELVEKISSVLYKRRADDNTRLQQLARSPYLYGTDVSASCYLKTQYNTKWPEYVDKIPASIACFDIETDVVHGHGKIVCMSITMGYNAILCYTKDFVGHIPNAIEKTREKIRYYLAERLNTKEDPHAFEKYQYDVRIVESPAQAVIQCMQKVHEWQPDYLLGWNIAFDIPRMLQALNEEGYRPEDVFSDPRVPPKYRIARWVPPKTDKVSASGRKTNLTLEQTWPMFYTMATYQVMDAMCGYKFVRLGRPDEGRYSLDAVLERNKCHTKLKAIPGTEGFTELAWHEEMQTNHQIDYGVYNLWDNQGIEALDQKTKDYSMTIPIRLAASDLKDFSSNPKRICDKLFFVYLNRGEVMGCTADDMTQEEDKWVISRTGHIVTLPCDLMADNGIHLFWDMPNLRSYIRLFVADLDISSSYPNGQILLNLSRACVFRELSRIEGVSDYQFRKLGINFITGGKTNAVDFCRIVYKAPSMFELLEHFDATRPKEEARTIE